ncbi:hypothetical protein HDU76_004519, partial [Blyttiomyces sp. JEL0837]
MARGRVRNGKRSQKPVETTQRTSRKLSLVNIEQQAGSASCRIAANSRSRHDEPVNPIASSSSVAVVENPVPIQSDKIQEGHHEPWSKRLRLRAPVNYVVKKEESAFEESQLKPKEKASAEDTIGTQPTVKIGGIKINYSEKTRKVAQSKDVVRKTTSGRIEIRKLKPRVAKSESPVPDVTSNIPVASENDDQVVENRVGVSRCVALTTDVEAGMDVDETDGNMAGAQADKENVDPGTSSTAPTSILPPRLPFPRIPFREMDATEISQRSIGLNVPVPAVPFYTQLVKEPVDAQTLTNPEFIGKFRLRGLQRVESDVEKVTQSSLIGEDHAAAAGSQPGPSDAGPSCSVDMDMVVDRLEGNMVQQQGGTESLDDHD